MEREALFIVMFREGSLLERFGSVLDRKASPKLLNAPLASLAALARSLRSPDRVELSMLFTVCSKLFYYRGCQHISIDLSWIFMPTWLHVSLIFRLLGRLGGVLDASWPRLRVLWARLGASWGVSGSLGDVLACLGPSWKRLGGVLGASWKRLGSVLNSTSTSTSKSSQKPCKISGFFTFLEPSWLPKPPPT